MDIIKLYEDYGIDYKTEGHKHCREGWVNTPCPFCSGNPGYHLGFPLDGYVFKCYRCGKHSIVEGLAGLLSISLSEAKRIAKEYKGIATQNKATKQQIIKPLGFKYPTNTGPLQKQHKLYLQQRGFDPDKLEEKYGLMGTGPISLLSDGKKKIDYKHRIIIPIYWNGRLCTFQARSIKKVTEHSDLKYLAAPKSREIMHHKHILYADPKNWEKMKGGTGIVVEGVTDVWKLGDNAVATFGIEYKTQQVIELAKHLKRAAIVFDEEPQARRQAKRLVEDLLLMGVDAWYVPVTKDPGSMSEKEAKYLVKQLLK